MVHISILNDNYYPKTLIENIESLIWTDRFSDIGDFQLVMPYDKDIWNKLPNGTLLGMSESKRIMISRRRKISKNSNGTDVMSFSGFDMLSMLKDRVTRTPISGAFEHSTDLARWLVDITATVSGAGWDAIPQLETQLGPGVPAGPDRDPKVSNAYRFANLFEAIKDICDPLEFGFCIEKTDPGSITTEITFFIHRGRELSTIRSIDTLGYLSDIEIIEDDANYKNVAYSKRVGADPKVTYQHEINKMTDQPKYLERRVLGIDSTNIDPNDYSTHDDWLLAIDLVARAEMAKGKKVVAIDGQVNPSWAMEYRGVSQVISDSDTQFRLGDFFTVTTSLNNIEVEYRITEYIWSVDSSGITRYPTFQQVEIDEHTA